jgi:chemotaxis protein CheD
MIDAEPTTEIRVKVAECAVGRDEQTLITIGLGSCVAILLYDQRVRVGGMAHTLLPDESMARDRSNPAKFPASAVALLLA